jgi:hypothetical protein
VKKFHHRILISINPAACIEVEHGPDQRSLQSPGCSRVQAGVESNVITLRIFEEEASPWLRISR